MNVFYSNENRPRWKIHYLYYTTTLYRDYHSRYATVPIPLGSEPPIITLYIAIAYIRVHIYISYARTRPIIYIGPFRYSSGPYPTYIRRRCHVYNIIYDISNVYSFPIGIYICILYRYIYLCTVTRCETCLPIYYYFSGTNRCRSDRLRPSLLSRTTYTRCCCRRPPYHNMERKKSTTDTIDVSTVSRIIYIYIYMYTFIYT